ncbi:helix-turn-helix domain-containing protein [Streptomyces lincolnensis]|uniref:helix-turn-helix domain-containing protein n=1 Tax=Streptomyces lincolnensis TaxID=1915 RepID=UPI001E31557A|nr:helix-turn-helix transcriptional regulator [Streptomyces lincolnensis]
MTNHQPDPGASDAEAPARDGEDLAALLERLLEEVPGRTQKELATEAGVSYQTLNAWVRRTRGTSRIDPDTLRSLARVFSKWGIEVSVRQFFDAAGRPVAGPADEEREAHLLRVYRQLPEDKQRLLVEDAQVMLRIASAS